MNNIAIGLMSTAFVGFMYLANETSQPTTEGCSVVVTDGDTDSVSEYEFVKSSDAYQFATLISIGSEDDTKINCK